MGRQMRGDMAQVLIDRPRDGMRSGYRSRRRALKRERIDETSARQPINGRVPYSRTKSQTDLFGPLFRYLNRQVGRPWDLVWSEICDRADARNVAQHHLRFHVLYFVDTRVTTIDGVLYTNSPYVGLRPLRPGGYRPTLYVCPRSGLLKRLTKHSNDQGEIRRVCLSDREQLHWRDGQWFRVELRTLPEETQGEYDAWFGRYLHEISDRVRMKCYGQDAYSLSYRAATAKEMGMIRRGKRTR